jgi:diguanylate cyclase
VPLVPWGVSPRSPGRGGDRPPVSSTTPRGAEGAAGVNPAAPGDDRAGVTAHWPPAARRAGPIAGARSAARALGVAAAAMLALVVATTVVEGDSRLQIANLGVLVLAFGAAASCAGAARRSRGRSRRGWIALALAAASWGAGQIAWTVSELLLGDLVPFPSIADVGYLGFPVAALVGTTLLAPRTQGLATSRRLIDAFMVGCALGLVAWLIAVDPIATGLSPGAAAVALAYPIADVVLITVVLLTLAQTREKPLLWGLLAASMGAMIVSDVAFSYATADGSYASGAQTDWGWWAAFCLLGAAGGIVGRPGSRQGHLRPPPAEVVASAGLLPYLPLGAAVVVAAVASTGGRGLDPVSVGLVVLLVALVLARQYAAVRENHTLAHAVQQRERELQHLAFHDTLTGLANRALFLDRLDHALRRAERDRTAVAVVFCDLDGFKAVNDALGHAVGDALLVRVAERLRGALRAGDTLARLGGDEFAVLVERGADAGVVAHTLLAALRTPFHLGGRTVTVSASIGVAGTDPATEPVTAGTLLHRADVAMYAVKASGRSDVRTHSPALDIARRDEPALHRAFAAAVQDGGAGGDPDAGIRAVYQPVVDPATGRIGALEALARWTHEGAPVSPEVFVPIAEQTGLSEQLTALMLEQAGAQLAAWNAALEHRRLRVAVNINPTELSDRGLPGRIAALVARHRLAPGQLILEMTESAATNRPEDAVDVLLRLRATGVRIALDDFGTGYSTLARLSSTPVDTVKIDRFFVADIDHDVRQKRFLVGLLELTRHLGVRTVAEGVERAGQLRELRRLGCDLVQGHLIARPAAPEELTPLVLADTPLLPPHLLGLTPAGPGSLEA